MVFLTITPAIVEAFQHRKEKAPGDRPIVEEEPTLEDPAVGKPIYHSQILDLWEDLRAQEDGEAKYSLESLLRGSAVYIPPPAPKPEPVSSSSFPLLLPTVVYSLD